jgi:tRNA A37 N6-isopentenylltransferase MiaA
MNKLTAKQKSENQNTVLHEVLDVTDMNKTVQLKN